MTTPTWSGHDDAPMILQLSMPPVNSVKRSRPAEIIVDNSLDTTPVSAIHCNQQICVPVFHPSTQLAKHMIGHDGNVSSTAAHGSAFHGCILCLRLDDLGTQSGDLGFHVLTSHDCGGCDWLNGLDSQTLDLCLGLCNCLDVCNLLRLGLVQRLGSLADLLVRPCHSFLGPLDELNGMNNLGLQRWSFCAFINAFFNNSTSSGFWYPKAAIEACMRAILAAAAERFDSGVRLPRTCGVSVCLESGDTPGARQGMSEGFV